ncbi:hypothetical protein TWF694_008105 [Orbilia ellipsospora]|uniref:Uncharacterized protein n=1 Tax=Orbilia ellipsospora TaxID=2528407 RepID=A0AAV9XF31_9PEZI
MAESTNRPGSSHSSIEVESVPRGPVIIENVAHQEPEYEIGNSSTSGNNTNYNRPYIAQFPNSSASSSSSRVGKIEVSQAPRSLSPPPLGSRNYANPLSQPIELENIHRNSLSVPSIQETQGSGTGYTQSSEVLSIRRPSLIAESEAIVSMKAGSSSSQTDAGGGLARPPSNSSSLNAQKHNVNPLFDNTANKPPTGNPLLTTDEPRNGAKAIVGNGRELNVWDVFALIFNKMVGSGILTTHIYLRYCEAWFFNGGELVFLDEIYRNILPTMFAFVLYGYHFLLLSNSGTNTNQFGRQVLTVANPDVYNNLDTASLSITLQTFIGIVCLTALCLLNYFSAKAGRVVNKSLALFKLCLLLALVVQGAKVVHNSDVHDISTNYGRSSSDTAVAFVLVLFSYQGWENATFVLGEIQNFSTLKTGFILAVGAVGVLYNIINILFIYAFEFDAERTQFAAALWGESDSTIRAWAILIAISSSANLLSVIYTSARVKQVFAESMAIPWSNLWKRVSEARKTPTGGLLLHWIFSVILVLASTSVKDRSDQVSLPGNIQVYGSAIISLSITIGFFIFPNKILDMSYEKRRHPTQLVDSRKYDKSGWLARTLHYRLGFWDSLVGFSYLAGNITLVSVSCIPTKYTNIQGWVWLAVNIISLAVIALFYCLGRLVWRKYTKDGSVAHTKFAGVSVEFDEPEEVDPVMGARTKLKFTFDEKTSFKKWKQFWYWFFSGEIAPGATQSPIQPFRNRINAISERIQGIPDYLVYKWRSRNGSTTILSPQAVQ